VRRKGIRFARNSIALKVPRNIDDDNPAVTTDEQDDFKQVSAAVVKEILPPVADDEFRDEDADFLKCGFVLHAQNVIHDGLKDVAVGRRERDEFGERIARFPERFGNAVLPFIAKGVWLIGKLNVHAADIVRQRKRETKRLLRNPTPAVNGKHHDGLAEFRGADAAVEVDFARNVAVMGVNSAHKEDHQRNEQGRDPGA